MRKLTLKTAHKKAVALFGNKATVREGRCYIYECHPSMSCRGIHEQPCPGNRPVYVIGKVVLGMFNEIRGEGATWEEALEKAAKYDSPLGRRA